MNAVRKRIDLLLVVFFVSGFSGLISWRGFSGAISKTCPPVITNPSTASVASVAPE